MSVCKLSNIHHRELPDGLIRKLLRHLVLFPSITMIVDQNPLGKWEKPGETIVNRTIGMRMAMFDIRQTNVV